MESIPAHHNRVGSMRLLAEERHHNRRRGHHAEQRYAGLLQLLN